MKKSKCKITTSLCLFISCFSFSYMPVHAEDISKTKENINVQYAKQTEEQALIQVDAKNTEKIGLPSGNIVHSRKINYVTSQNGTYIFSEADNSKNHVEKSVNVLDLRRELLVTDKPEVKLKLYSEDHLSGNDEMRFKNDDGNWSTFEKYKTEKDWKLKDEEGLRIVSVQYKDMAGNISDEVFDRIFLDKTGPEVSFNINSGNEYTNKEQVILNITATDNYSYPEKVLVSTDNKTWIEEPFSEKIPVTLPLGDGEKKIYVKVLDALGNASDVITQSIILDKTNPYGTVSINNGAIIVPSKQVDLSITLGDKLSGINKVKVIEGDKEYIFPVVPKENITIPWELSGDSNGQVTLLLIDNAGNVAKIESNKVLIANLNITEFELTNVVNPMEPAFKPMTWAFEPQKMIAGGNIEFAIYYDLFSDEQVKSSSIEGNYTVEIVGDDGYYYTSSTNYTSELPLPDKGFNAVTLIPNDAPKNAKVFLSSHLKAKLQTAKEEVILEDAFPDKNGKALIGTVNGFIKDRIKFNEIR
ncbi:hypothetical protein [Bacillus sp. NPDC094106]|uniref:hypothetical protein n=1 Tax=Bacillus sp. NPDC094106 TaxID=3363949 RepID=UPI003824CB3E